MVVFHLHPVLLVLFLSRGVQKTSFCFQLCEAGIAAMKINFVHRRHIVMELVLLFPNTFWIVGL